MTQKAFHCLLAHLALMPKSVYIDLSDVCCRPCCHLPGHMFYNRNFLSCTHEDMSLVYAHELLDQ